MSSYLKKSLKNEIYAHGSLLNIFSLGVLIIGSSGIGKSECALSLIDRGHQLIADDVVRISIFDQTSLIGTAHSLIRYHMEIRGLGIINIAELFGKKAVAKKKIIDLVVLLEKWSDNNTYDHFCADQEYKVFLGIKIPLVRLPIAPCRNIAIILETAVRKELLNRKGIYPAKEIEEKIKNKLEKVSRLHLIKN